MSLPSPAPSAPHADASSDPDLCPAQTLVGTILVQDERVVDVNAQMAASFGYERDAFVGLPLPAFVHPDDLPEVRRRVAERLAGTRRDHRYGFRGLRRDGTPIHLEVHGFATAHAGRPAVRAVVLDVTARRVAEAQLRESDARYRSLFEHSHATMLLVDPASGDIADANSAAARFYGCSRDALRRRKIWEIDTRPASDVRAQLARALTSDRTASQFQHRLSSGAVRDVEVHMGPVALDGRLFCLSIVHDVTERHVAEEALRLRGAAVEAAANGIVITDARGVIVWANPAFTTLTGYPVDEVLGRTPSLLKSGVQDEAFYAALWRTIRAGDVWKGTLCNRRKDGTRYTEEMTITPVRDAAGAITHFVAVKQDVTARQEAEARLREQETRLRLALEAGRMGLWDWDLARREMTWSPQTYALFGRDPATFDGHRYAFADLVHPDDRDRVVAAWHAAMAGDGGLDVEYRVERPDGRLVWMHARAQLFRDDQDQPVRVTGTVADVTERKEAEQAREESYRFLRSTLDALSSHIAVLDADGIIVATNAAWDRFARDNGGQPEATGVGADYLAACEGDAIGRDIAAGIRDVLAGRRPACSVEYACHGPAGPQWFNARVSRFSGPGPQRVVVAHEPITERKAAEAARDESRLQLSRIIDSAMDAIITIDAQHRIHLFNHAAEQLFGYTAEEAIGLPLSRLLPERFRAAHDAHVRAFGQTGTTARPMGRLGAVYGLRRDGEEFPMEASISHVQTGGRPLFTVILRDVTARQEAERRQQDLLAQLRRERARLEAVLEHMPLGVMLVEAPSGRLLLGNEQVDRIFRRPTPESRSLEDYAVYKGFHKDGRPFEVEDWPMARAMLHGDVTQNEEIEIERGDGTRGVIAVNAAPIRGDDDDIIAVVGAFIDVTEQRRAKAALRESELRYRLALRATNDVVWDLDVAADRVTWNDALGTVFGYPDEARDGTVPDWWAERVHPDDRARVVRGAATVREGDVWTAEFRFRRADGTYAWVLDRGFALRDADGRVVRIVGAMSDLTERMEAQQALQASEARWRRLVENHPDPVALVQDEQVVYVNPTLAALAHAPDADALVGRPVADVVAPEDRHELQACLRRAADEQRVMALPELRLEQAGTPPRYVDGVIVPMAHDGRPAQQVVLRDVTVRRAYEQALMKAKREAEEIARFKTSVLNNMSHEIRTPLTTILGFSDLLLDELDEPHRELAEMIHRGGQRLLDTLNSVLDLAQLESGTLEMKRDRVVVTEEIQEVLDLLAPQAREKGLEMRLQAAVGPDPAGPGRAVARLDRKALHRVMTNLVGNAIKFTREGRVVVRVAAEADTVRIAVADTGEGMSDAFVGRLFQEFVQESTGINRAHEGNGLGLAITKRLVELMGGTISVESRKGEGSTFEVCLPRGFDAGDPAAAGRRRATVLVVEDQRETRLVLRSMLGPHYDVHEAASGPEALQQAALRPHDVVLMDIQLGDHVTGTDVLRTLRQLPAYRRTPVVAVTAQALPDDRDRLLRAGFDAYLAKPFTRAQLTAVIRHILKRRAS